MVAKTGWINCATVWRRVAGEMPIASDVAANAAVVRLLRDGHVTQRQADKGEVSKTGRKQRQVDFERNRGLEALFAVLLS